MLTGFNELKQKETTLTMANYFLWLGIVHSLPCEWRRMIKAGNISLFSQPTLPRNFRSDQLNVKPNENSVVELANKYTKSNVTKSTLEPTRAYSYIFRKQFSIKFRSTRHLIREQERFNSKYFTEFFLPIQLFLR